MKGPLAPRQPMSELVAGVRAHAQAHYEKDGWDFVVETMDDAELVSIIGKSRYVETAIEWVRKAVKVNDDYRQDIINA